MFCPQCGAKNPDSNKFCSKCGAALKAEAAPAAPTPVAAGGKTSGMSIAALIMGILGLIFLWPLSILAIIFGGVGMSQTGKDPTLKGRGMAVTGLVLGILGIVCWVIVAIIWWGTFWWWF